MSEPKSYIKLRSGKIYAKQEVQNKPKRRLNNSPTEELFIETDNQSTPVKQIDDSQLKEVSNLLEPEEFINPSRSFKISSDESEDEFYELSVRSLFIEEFVNMAQFNRHDFKDIPEFRGDPRELPRFVLMVTRMHDSLDVANKVILFEKLASKLMDRAFELHTENVLRSWDTLKAELEGRFLIQRDPVVLIGELQRIYQGRGESVRNYACRISDKLATIKQATANRNVSAAAKLLFTEEHSRVALITFKNGLKDPLRTIVKAARDQTLQAAIVSAIDEEESSNQFVPQMNYSPRQGSIPTLPVKTENRPYKNPFTPEIQCTRCHYTNHSDEKCYANFDREGNKLPPAEIKKEINTFISDLDTASKNSMSNDTIGQMSLSQNL